MLPLRLADYPSVTVLSPHLDDAALSCGALIFDASRVGCDIQVVTVFGGAPTLPISESAKSFHDACGLSDERAMHERSSEDDRALAVLGARSERLNLLEALYRVNSSGESCYDFEGAVFQGDVLDEGQELERVTAQLTVVLDRLDPDLVVAPLGIGNHIDHLLVSAAAKRLGRRFLFYEDVPYVTIGRFDGWRREFPAGEARIHDCSAEAWAAKIKSIECYSSQLEVLWFNPQSWRNDLASYASSVSHGNRAERYWTFCEE